MTTPNTTCLYPELAVSTALSRGCRCPRCKQARYVKHCKYYKKNVEKLKIYDTQYRARNVKKITTRTKLYRKNNAEKIKSAEKLYRKNNAEKVKAHKALYWQENAERIRLQRQTPVNKIRSTMSRAKCRMLRIGKHLVPPLNLEEETRMYKIYETRYYLSESTGVMHHVDHIIPGSKGGLHHPDNLQILTASENCKKKDKIL